jgi:hypothetical protein
MLQLSQYASQPLKVPILLVDGDESLRLRSILQHRKLNTSTVHVTAGTIATHRKVKKTGIMNIIDIILT